LIAMTTLAMRLLVTLVFVYLLVPIAIVIITSFSASPGLVFPPAGFTLHWYRNISPEFVEAMRVSLVVALGTTALATVVGTPAAIGIVRSRIHGKTLISMLFMSPLMVSTFVIGVAGLLYTTKIWEVTGVSFGGNIQTLILGQSAFTIPFVIRAVITSHAHFDHSLEEVSLNLGATPWHTFRRVTLPILMPGIISGAIIAFIVSFDDVPVALFLGGGDAVTLPVKIYTSVEFAIDADVMAVGSIVIGGSLICMLLLDRLIGLDRFFGSANA
jgi:putative spermidine/putrescine transport system permease protein